VTSWRDLDAELDAWAETGRHAEFWWRDDDAAEDAPALARLLDLAKAAPLAIAAIPATLSDAAAARIAAAPPDCRVLQHGYAHANHARDGEKKIELGGSNAPDACERQLRDGFAALGERFGKKFLPVLVPPWNRIDAALIPRLPALGFRAISTYADHRVEGLGQLNCHVDILDWRAGAVFVGEDTALALACTHLAAKRRGDADAGAATGILSHHLRHDDAVWHFLAAFFARIAGHPGARWRSPAELFGGGQ
jgi:hypothetical protein